ncbi:hypothetical protein [Exiguobacterium sp. K1]|uniref:hypothetical protein n=1 Tax=Exiguobacterium sp. K1 TaxID=2980105 RepID=UPI00299EFAFE|nr:hypothetical protein [Exiguobacterium sp. K1]MDX1259636.1 hypothetical protein [Exiguobacterium sp. K1]
MREGLSTYQKWTTVSRRLRTYVIAGLFLTIVLFSRSLPLTEMGSGVLILVPLFVYNGFQRAIQFFFLQRHTASRKIGFVFGGVTLLEAVYLMGAAFIAPHLGHMGYLFPLMLWISAILQFQRWTDRTVQNSQTLKPVRLKAKGNEYQYQTGDGIEMEWDRHDGMKRR